MEKKIFVLIQKNFFKENGIDYAMAIGYSDISLHGDYDAADNAREELIHRLVDLYPECEDKIRFAKNVMSDFAELRIPSRGWRIVLEIMEKEIESFTI